MTIGDRIKNAREELGYKQSQLADLVGVSPSAIANYENDISFPKEPILLRLFDALQVDANYLFQDSMNVEENTKKEPDTAGDDEQARLKMILIKLIDEMDLHQLRKFNKVIKYVNLSDGEFERLYGIAQIAIPDLQDK